ncbi:MAG TPA: hypothetical protein VI391_08160 [Thermoanaerobaculia bacterium]
MARTRKIGILLALLVCANALAQETAEQHYRRGVDLGEQAMHASIFRRAGLAIKARQEFERAVQVDPDFIDARVALVEYYLRAPVFLGGSDHKAIAQAHEIMKRDPAEGHRAFALIYEHQKKHAEAAKELEMAAALDRQQSAQ